MQVLFCECVLVLLARWVWMRLVVRVGGSVVASPFNPKLMSEYVDLLLDLKRRGHVAACVVGGGSLSRELIRTAKSMGLDEAGQDEVAILVSRLVAQLFVLKLGESGAGRVPTVVEDAAKLVEAGKVVVMGGLKPGMTTDAVAAMLAERINADLLVKATDQDGVFNRDPRKFPDAHLLDSLRFDDLGKLFEADRHRAGIHQILDPEAVRLLQKRRIKTVVVNGSKPANVMLAVEGRKVGTVIS
jgi:uridylate kinase